MANEILRLFTGERLELKKPHPCGSRIFTVLRVGSDVRILCEGCGRDMVLDRVKLEKAVRQKLSVPKNDENK
ncbi:MAG: DUF951 domain-containing protein [Clostridia bacterium]|nr:DUF951 domain-containing protein [Clostridia bacterium]